MAIAKSPRAHQDVSLVPTTKKARRPVQAEDEVADRRTRGGHLPTGTGANRRAKATTTPSAKGEKSRAALIEAARRVFERVGYLDARVSDIAKEADVAHGSYYTYFDSKKAVFQAVVTDVSAEIDSAVAHHSTDQTGDPIGNLLNANRRYLEAYYANSKMLTLIEQVATTDPEIHRHRIASRRRHVQRVASTIRRLQERGDADPAIDAFTTAGALVAMLSSFAYWSTIHIDDYRDVDQVVTDIWIRAIGLKKNKRVGAARAS